MSKTPPLSNSCFSQLTLDGPDTAIQLLVSIEPFTRLLSPDFSPFSSQTSGNALHQTVSREIDARQSVPQKRLKPTLPNTFHDYNWYEWQQTLTIRHSDLPEATLARHFGRAIYNLRGKWTLPLPLIEEMSSAYASIRFDFSYADLALGMAGRAAFWGRRCLLHDHCRMTRLEKAAWE